MEVGRFKACSSGGAFFIFTTTADAAAACLALGAFIAPPPSPSLPMLQTRAPWLASSFARKLAGSL